MADLAGDDELPFVIDVQPQQVALPLAPPLDADDAGLPALPEFIPPAPPAAKSRPRPRLPLPASARRGGVVDRACLYATAAAKTRSGPRPTPLISRPIEARPEAALIAPLSGARGADLTGEIMGPLPPSDGGAGGAGPSPITPLIEPLTPPATPPGRPGDDCPPAFSLPLPKFATGFLAAPHQVPVPDDDDDLLLDVTWATA